MNRASRFGAVPALALGGMLLAFPQAAAQGFAAGVQLCVSNVLPALFPFFVICELVMAAPGAQRLALPLRRPARWIGLRHPSAPLVLLLSWLGGYAVCAKTVRQLRPQLSEREAQLLLLVGCCSGPGFVVGCVGGLMLGSVQLGGLLYALQLAANLLAAAFVCPFLPAALEGHTCPAPDTPQPIRLPEAISRGVDSSLAVCGCVVFFRLAGTVLAAWWPALPHISGLLEISAGCADFAALGGRAALYGCCACLSVLGLSVWAQLDLLLGGCVSLAPLAASRAVHLLLYPFLVGLCARFLPGTAAAYSSLQARVVAANRLAPDAAVITALFLCAALYKARKSIYNN